jgi:release factor glutamine methyltransferase
VNPAVIETTEALLREGVERLRDAGSETPRLDAELLLGDVVGAGRTVILAHPEAPVGADAASRYRLNLERRVAGEPVAYLRGLKEFYGLAFSVDRRALIPRPETERLVDLAEAEAMRRLGARPADEPPIRIVDVGTGAGAIAVTLAVLLRRRGALESVELLATDRSPDALDLARENAVGHAVGAAIEFRVSDLLATRADPADRPYDLVLANLPYVRHDALVSLPVAASYEPVVALDGGHDGLAVITRLLEQLPAELADGGLALLEIGADQRDAIVERCQDRLPSWTCTVEPDLAGLPRVAQIRRG